MGKNQEKIKKPLTVLKMVWLLSIQMRTGSVICVFKASLSIIISPADSMSIMTLLRQSFHLEELMSERSMNISRMRLIPVLEHTQTLINMLNPKA